MFNLETLTNPLMNSTKGQEVMTLTNQGPQVDRKHEATPIRQLLWKLRVIMVQQVGGVDGCLR